MLALTRAHRADLQTLTGLAANDLSLIWAKFNAADAASVRDGLAEVLPKLVAVYGSAAATLGADWYDEMRAAAGVRGAFMAIPAATAEQAKLEVLARVAVGSLFGAKPDPAAALTIATGGLQRHIANADRETVLVSSVQDRAARGWARVGVGGCSFCSMLLSRGAVYTEATADFAAHDHCHCSAEPVFG